MQSKLLQKKSLAHSCPACAFLTVHSIKLFSEIILWMVGLWKAAPILTVVKARVIAALLRIFFLLFLISSARFLYHAFSETC